MTWLRYGTDNIRDKWYVEGQNKSKHYTERVALAKKLEGLSEDIDDKLAYKICDLKDFVSNDLLLKEAQSYNIKTPTFKKNKDFLSTSLISKKLDISSPIMKLAIDKKVIATVSKYMGHIPLLVAVELWHSRYFSDNFIASQLWHCDWENPRSMKVFINISDVNEDNGPFTFLPADISKTIRDEVKYTYGEPGYRITDDKMSKLTDITTAVKLIGKEKMVFMDSCRCFHFGSRVSKGANPRILLLYKYLSPASINLMPEIKKQPPFLYIADQTEDTYEKYILGYKHK